MIRVKQLSYQKKAVLLFSLLISLLILVFLAIYTNSQSKSIKEKEQDTMEQLSVRAVTQFGELLENMHRISLGVASDKHVLRVLEQAENYNGEENYFQKYPQERKTIQMVLMNLIGEDFRNRSFHVISARDDWLNLDIYNEAYMNKEGIEALPWREKMRDEEYIKYITPFTEDGYGRTKEKVFSYVRQIQDEYQKLGYIDIQYEKKLLDDIFTLQMNNYPVQVAVYHGGELFYGKDLKNKEHLESIRQEMEFTEEGNIQEVKAGGRKYLVYGADNTAFEMQVCLYVDVNSYMGVIYQNLAWIIVLGVILLCIMILLVTLVTENLYRPIRQLRDSIQHMNYGELALNRNIEDTDDEIQMLTSAFYDMLDKMKKSRNELVEAKTRAVRARYEVLQAQINPHFLYNTLDNIIWLAESKKTDEVVMMVSSLSTFFRTSLSKGREFVSVKEETEHIRSYLEIQQFRYRDILDYEIAIPEEYYGYEVIKLTLQPLVENALYHGIKNKRGKGHITVSAERCADVLIFKVKDNGIGMDKQRLAEVCAMLKEDGNTKKENDGFGLFNVNQRIQLHYGTEYGLKVQSTYGEETEVWVRIPVRTESSS